MGSHLTLFHDKVEYLLSELNAASELINRLEELLSQAIVKREYLIGPAVDFHNRLLETTGSSESNSSINYLDSLAACESMKYGVRDAADSYLRNISAYEEARKCFDSYAGECHHLTCLTPKHISQLSQLSFEVFVTQKSRDQSEVQYVELLSKFRQLLQEIDSLKKSIDLDSVYLVESEFSNMSHIDAQIKSEEEIANRTRVELRLAKCNYRGIMLRLQEVSRDARLLNTAKTPID